MAKSPPSVRGCSGGTLVAAPMLTLRQVVDRYLQIAGSFGAPVSLDAFGLSPDDTRLLFSALDEDYHISRFLHFSSEPGSSYLVDGFPATHLSIDADVQSIL